MSGVDDERVPLAELHALDAAERLEERRPAPGQLEDEQSLAAEERRAAPPRLHVDVGVGGDVRPALDVQRLALEFDGDDVADGRGAEDEPDVLLDVRRLAGEFDVTAVVRPDRGLPAGAEEVSCHVSDIIRS